MKSLRLTFVCFAIVLFHYSYGEVKSSTLQPTMQKLLRNMLELRPYMIDDEKFLDSANEKKIGDRLQEMVTLIKGASHEAVLESPTLNISRQVLENHFVEAERIFRVGNKSYARWELNSTFPICMSCHTQSPSASKYWNLDELSTKSGNDFERAEFLFMGRNFDSAIDYYNSAIDGFPNNKIRAEWIEKAIERKVAAFARVKRDFGQGLASMEKSLKNKNLPDHIKKNVEAWATLFRSQSKMKFPDPKTSNDKEIREYVEKELKTGLWDKMNPASNPRLVTNLTVSGILYEYLNTHPDTAMKPDILYWLAACDRDLGDNFFFSLEDLYLKECVTRFPDSPIAKKCFADYELNMIVSYSGTAGTILPPEVRKELNLMRQMVFRER